MTGGLFAVLVACAPRPVAEPARPEASVEASPPGPAPVARSSAAPREPLPSPLDEISGLDPDAQWAWAVERMPALAEHAAIDRAELLAQLPEWFPEGRVFVRVAGSGKCFAVDGAWTGDAFVGRAHERVKTRGRTRERVWSTVVKHRSFTGTPTMEGAVYKSRRACERDPRWTTAAAAHERVDP